MEKLKNVNESNLRCAMQLIKTDFTAEQLARQTEDESLGVKITTVQNELNTKINNLTCTNLLDSGFLITSLSQNAGQIMYTVSDSVHVNNLSTTALTCNTPPQADIDVVRNLEYKSLKKNLAYAGNGLNMYTSLYLEKDLDCGDSTTRIFLESNDYNNYTHIVATLGIWDANGVEVVKTIMYPFSKATDGSYVCTFIPVHDSCWLRVECGTLYTLRFGGVGVAGQWLEHTGLFLSGIFRYDADYEDKQKLESLSDLEKFQHEGDFYLNTVYSCWLV